MFSPVSEFEVRIMDVGQQSNASADCVVLGIAFAFDMLWERSMQCKIRSQIYKASFAIVQARCLEEWKLTHFPILGERTSSGI